MGTLDTALHLKPPWTSNHGNHASEAEISLISSKKFMSRQRTSGAAVSYYATNDPNHTAKVTHIEIYYSEVTDAEYRIKARVESCYQPLHLISVFDI